MKLTGERGLLRWLEYVAYPAAAGAAFMLLCLGVVTWLPALAAVAYTLQKWRHEGDSRCFVGVFRAWRRYQRQLLRHSIASTLALALLGVDMVFLATRTEPGSAMIAFALLAVQVGIGAAFVTYHLALAVVAGREPDAGPVHWRRSAVAFAFGSVTRGTALLGAAIAAPILTIVVPLGPLLLGTSLPVLVGLVIADHHDPSAQDSHAPVAADSDGPEHAHERPHRERSHRQLPTGGSPTRPSVSLSAPRPASEELDGRSSRRHCG